MKSPTLWLIIGLALVLRLTAAVFSTGYAMHDDHFVIEDGPYQWQLADHGGWFDRDTPPGHSVVYPSILYAVMAAEEALGMDDPKMQMFGLRLLHALWSVLAIPFIWALGKRFGGERAAITASVFYAALWFLPFMSVRQLIEMVSIPPLMMACWYAVKDEGKSDLLISGAAFALAFAFRYQTATVAVGVVLGLVLLGKGQRAAILTAWSILWAFVIQGTADVLAWGYPFAGPLAYVRGILEVGDGLPSGTWYSYPLLLLGVFLPPASILLFWNVATMRNKTLHLLLTMPMLLFLIVHMAIPNRQERFILPIIGLLVVLIAVGITTSLPSQRIKLWWKGAVAYFIVLNTVLLCLMTVSSSKASRVDAMYALRELKAERVLVLTERGVQPPTFYAGHDVKITTMYNASEDDVRRELSEGRHDYVVCLGDRQRQVFERVDTGGYEIGLFESSGLDRLLYFMNPRGNRNETSAIYPVH